MKRLNVILLSAALVVSSSVAAKESDTETLKIKLKPWQPSEIALKSDQITVVLPSAKINSDIYGSIISGGVCSPIWTKDVPTGYLKNIKQINVINKFKAIGYSFENPLNVCKEMGNLMDKPATAVMLGNTHTYTGK
jgi:hypothetical protein